MKEFESLSWWRRRSSEPPAVLSGRSFGAEADAAGWADARVPGQGRQRLSPTVGRINVLLL
jgi:hypothetical protein